MCNKERVLTSICMKAFQKYLSASDFVRASVCTLGLDQDVHRNARRGYITWCPICNWHIFVMYNMYKPLCEGEAYIQSPMEYGQFTFDIYRTIDLHSPCRYNGPFLKAHFKKIKRSASPLSSNLFDFSVTCYPSLLVVTEYTKIKIKIPSSLLNSDSSLWYTLFPFQTERFKCCHSVLNNLQKLSSFFWLIY